MSTKASQPATTNRQRVAATAVIPAAAQQIYKLLSDYRDGHPKILPPAHFKDLVVEQGGQGAGTVIRFKSMALGVTNSMRMVVTEPEPGRVLVESDSAKGIVTTFTLNQLKPNETQLEIATELSTKSGLAGVIEKFMNKRVLQTIYRKELGLIAEYFQPSAN